MSINKLSTLAKQPNGTIPMEGMKYLKYIFVLALFGILGCSREPVTYKSPDGQFSILMPGQSLFMNSKVTGESEPFHTIAAEGRGAMYMLVYKDYAAPPCCPESLFNARRDDQFQKAPGNLVTDSAVSLGAYPGREIEIRFPDGIMTRIRYFLAGRRLYEVYVFGRPERNFVNRYFESFTVIQNTTGKE